MENAASCSEMHKEELKVLHNIVDLMPYLHSEVHDLFKFYPSKAVMRQKNASFTNKVGTFVFPQEEIKLNPNAEIEPEVV